MKHTIIILCTLFIYFVATVFTAAVYANPLSCPKDEAKAAEALAPTADSWKQLHKQYKRYSHCDDGAIAEGFSEATTRLLSEKWKDISQLAVVLKLDPSFYDFVIHHTDGTVPAERLNQISENADKKCPSNMKDFCSELKIAVTNSLK